MKQPITIFGGYDPMKEVNELVVKARELKRKYTPELEFCACGNEKMNNSDYCKECI